jgi:uncharacterized secreted protein with C-terminal beta-propeller domain
MEKVVMNRLRKLLTDGARWVLLLSMLFIIAGCSSGKDDLPENDVPIRIAPGEESAGEEIPGEEIPGEEIPEELAPEEEVSNVGRVETLASEAELETYLKDQYAKSVYHNTYHRDVFTTEAAEAGAADSAAPNYSETNIQEVGVDESDVVKTDGAFFYVSDQNSFHIVKSSDPMQKVSTRTVDGNVGALYLYKQKLVVLYTPAQVGIEPWPQIAMPEPGGLFGMPYWIPVKQRQGIAIYDISDPSNPKNIKTVEFDGHLVSSRLINGKLHAVQQFVPQLPPLDYTYDGTQEELDKITAANAAALEDVPLKQLIPYYREVGGTLDPPVDLPLVSPQNFYRPISCDGGGTITTVVSFDLDDPKMAFSCVGLIANSHIVYASTQALYLATHKYDSEPRVAEVWVDMEKETTIYKFSLTGQGVQYVGGGGVDGWILNQFSLGEYRDILRIATTTGDLWDSTSRNHVYCLELKEQTLETIGSIEDLAPGEKIYSARFMGERGYLVTFVNIDPLFTLDLSDPSAPEVVGYLKVPGYSDYIHPYGEHHLITVGKDALPSDEDDFAWYQGVQLSIFDITDFSNPVLLHKQLIGDRGTSSEALHNHKAFTFWAENELLALPINLYEHQLPPKYPNQHGIKTFEGLYVYRVSVQNGFDLLGRISTENDTIYRNYNYWTRGIFVDQQVYAVTNNAVRSALTDQIEESAQTLYIVPNE